MDERTGPDRIGDRPTDPDRWAVVEALFHTAAGMRPEARRAYLRDACAGAPALERAVRRLLAAGERADGFIAGLIRREAGAVGDETSHRPVRGRTEPSRPGRDPTAGRKPP